MIRVPAHLHAAFRTGIVCSLACVFMAVAGCGDDGLEPESSGSTSLAPGDSSSGGVPNSLPTLQVEVAAADACGSASALEIRATRFGCVEPPPAPCTLTSPLRTEVGDRLACPFDGEGVFRLPVELSGRYYVELVTVAADASESSQCLTQGPTDFVLVEDAAFESNPTIALTAQADPCPSP